MTRGPRTSTRLRAWTLALAAAAIIGTSIGTAVAQDATPDATGDLPQIAVDYGAAWSSCDPVQLAAIYTEDAVFEEAILDAPILTGHEQLGAYQTAACSAFTGFAATAVRGFEVDGQAVVEWVLTGTYDGQFGPLPPGAGQAVEIRIASILVLEGDKIAAEVDYWDLATLLSQVGALGGEATPAGA